MRPIVLAATLFLGACGLPHVVFDKPGVAPGAGQADEAACETEAARKVPSHMQKVTVDVPIETNTYCSEYTNSCHSTTYGGGQRSYLEDANGPARNQVLLQCMARKGYTARTAY